jgi:hypothetical protein
VPDMTRKQAVQAIRTVVNDARWAGLSADEIRAVFMSALLESEPDR